MREIIKENEELWKRLFSERVNIVDEALEIIINLEETLGEEKSVRIFFLVGHFIDIISKIDKTLFPFNPASLFIVKDIFLEDKNNKNQESPIASYTEIKEKGPSYLVYLPRLIDYINDPKRQLKIIWVATKVGIHEVRHRIQDQYPQLELFTLGKINDLKKRAYKKRRKKIALFFEEMKKEIKTCKKREQDAYIISELALDFLLFKHPNLIPGFIKGEDPLPKILKLNASQFLV